MNKLELFAQTIYDFERLIDQIEAQNSTNAQSINHEENIGTRQILSRLRLAERIVQTDFDNERILQGSVQNIMVHNTTYEQFKNNLQQIIDLKIMDQAEQELNSKPQFAKSRSKQIYTLKIGALYRAMEIIQQQNQQSQK